MALALPRENFVLHKLHSLTGIVPVGYYMVQHLVLNAYSLGGPDKFNGVIDFFDSWPKFVLPLVEFCLIWLPLAFHGVYGLLITDRAKVNYFSSRYGWPQNRMYTFQRYSGIFILLFLIYHTIENTGMKYWTGDSNVVKFAAWQEQLSSHGHIWLFVYMLGVLLSCYHFCFGIWNFSIRWGIAISETAQLKVQRFSAVAFVLLTLVGWAALAGFLLPHGASPTVTL